MPVYFYRCCDHGIFKVEKPSDFVEQHTERCPECNGPTNRFYTWTERARRRPHMTVAPSGEGEKSS